MTNDKEIFIDCDFRKDPKTNHFCAVCQLDLDPNKPCEYVFVDAIQSCIFVHPNHVDDYEYVEKVAIGPECSKKVPKEFKVNE